MKSLDKLEATEATELFISTCKQLIKDGVDEVSKELKNVQLDNGIYDFKINISAIEVTDL